MSEQSPSQPAAEATETPEQPAPPYAQPANTNVSGSSQRPERKPLWDRITAIGARIDDGSVLRWCFRAILAGSAVVLALDLKEIRQQENASWPVPTLSPGDTAPVLPPALSDGEPEAPPFEIVTPPETLTKGASFDLAGGGVLAIEGAIDPGAADRFAAEIEARGEYVETVRLNSPGGSVEDALAIARLIRERGYATRVEDGNLCASSCPLILAGGTQRQIGPEAVIGVHQVYGVGSAPPSPAEAMYSAQSTTARVTRHLVDMGVSSELWLHALETAPDRLYYLSAEEMAEYRLTTGGE
jgi:hypothetical protein